ncbi:hypothetical protein BO85DRAFT_447423 [Aspergillus piperis CBS 112811]|uniref:Uncharacterized protein n=2 Tax=Aspergillus subgen. Circumdati TaxID=2720871 RepID=A0A8G1VN51_9EURO|nr:uncharacterized protein BO83DRAFT_404083 [Aspergillus eucalypticola CBS 122712]XP_025517461.1 hypothetical protein BO85DRAFT_447423 [Aspergillus piperis CBS 112811]PWY62151.1 hypothetical protein BO83DRAFT_404083 [Aspergillus eucalypticola CBS 122712]RAH59539.1 hypothetical protein BO85DRAFT_447423 [Aspergillus piperis CBS 112811]
MSVTTTSTGTAASASSTCINKLYDIPVKDAACAMPMRNNNSAIMSSCCGSASIVSYDSCDYYCLAQDQTVGTLAECLIKASEAGEVWCNTNANATATGSVPTTGAGTVVSTATATGGSSSTGSSTSSGSTASSTSGAGVAVTKKSVGVLALLFFGSTAGFLL